MVYKVDPFIVVQHVDVILAFAKGPNEVRCKTYETNAIKLEKKSLLKALERGKLRS